MPNSTRRQFLTAASTLASVSTLGFPCPALAQRWPAQDIHFVTGTAAGSGGDVIVRYFAEKLRPLAGRTIIVENRVGALGGIATEYVARSKPDGYTILIWGGSNVASMMAVRKKPPIDVVTALQIAGTIDRQAFMFVVDAKMPYYTLADLTKAMLAKGDERAMRPATTKRGVMGGSTDENRRHRGRDSIQSGGQLDQ